MRQGRGLLAAKVVVAAIAVWAPGRSAARAEDAPAGDVAADRAPFQARVDAAIDAGVAWLRGIQRDDGTFRLEPGSPIAGRPVRGDLPQGDPSQDWPGGPWDKGLDALCVYTLAACDVPVDDPALERGFDALRRHWRGREPGDDALRRRGAGDGISTYFVACCLLALDARHNRGVTALGKGAPPRSQRATVPVGATDSAWAAELVAWLVDAQDDGRTPRNARPLDGWRRPQPKDSDATATTPSSTPTLAEGGGFGYDRSDISWSYHDHSNSQFALLGLKSGARLGVAIDDAVWLRSLRHFIAAQAKEGPEVPRVDARGAASASRATSDAAGPTDHARGWAYSCAGSRFDPARNLGARPDVAEWGPSMTAGGVSSLVICRSELDGARVFDAGTAALTETAIRDGLAWLALDLDALTTAPSGPAARRRNDGLDDFYFLYGLERACVLAGVTRVGACDWWFTGAERILERQEESGAFRSRSIGYGNGRREIDTCFALLFLRRAVFRVPDATTTTPSSK